MSDILHKVCCVAYDAELDCVLMAWQGFATSYHFRKIYERVLELMENHNCNKLITDNKHMLTFSPSDQVWLVEEWLPRITAAGLKYSAIIAPALATPKSAVEDVVNKVNPDQIEQRFFASQAEAKEWIKSLR
ncbi:MAG: hypothetical protein V4642_08870 [Bacteroidota bacterium]